MKSKSDSDKSWIVIIIFISVLISMIFSFISEVTLAGAGYIVSFVILVLFIVLGIVFDIIGVAATSAVEAPFHSMASHGERGAAEAIRLIRNADKVSSICNDVIGDICGVMSGATSAVIVAKLALGFGIRTLPLQILISGLVAGFIVGGKAVGKTAALKNNVRILLAVGKVINTAGRIFGKKRGKG